MDIPDDLLRTIVHQGSNLRLHGRYPEELLRDLVSAAVKTGAHITLATHLPEDVIRELAVMGKGHVTFDDGMGQ
jgi:hypothetical protein